MFSPDGRTLASLGRQYAISLWDVDKAVHIQSFEGHSSEVTSVAFSPDGKTLASGSWDHTIRIWDVDTGEQISTFTKHTNWVYEM